MNKHPELDERDWFAAHAPMYVIMQNNPGGLDLAYIADAAYQYADAMMQRRMQKPNKEAQ